MRAIGAWGLVLWLGAAPWAWAGQYVLQAGQPNTVPVSARVLNGETHCNLVISVPGQAPFEREVQAPFFDTRIAITPVNTDSVTVRWHGQSRRVQERVVNGCPTEGQAQFKVVSDNVLTRAVWQGMQALMKPEKLSCVQTVFALDQVRPEWFDFTDPQRTGEDMKIERGFAQCDAFLAQPKAWGAQNPQSHACTVEGLKTRCEGYYTARINGKLQPITREVAIQRQLAHLPWSTGVREIGTVRAARIQQEKDRVARLAAEEAAQRQAIEDARLLAEKQAEEAKAAEQRALQDKIAALRAQIAEEKARAAQERNWLFRQIDKIKGDAPAEAAAQPAQPAQPAAAAAAAAAAAEVQSPASAPSASPASPDTPQPQPQPQPQ